MRTLGREAWLEARSLIARACILVGLGSLFTIGFAGDYSRNLRIGIDSFTISFAGLCFAVAGGLALLSYGKKELAEIRALRMGPPEEGECVPTRSALSLYLPWTAVLVPVLLICAAGALRLKFNAGAALVYFGLFAPVYAPLLFVSSRAETDKAAARPSLALLALAIFVSLRIFFLAQR